VGFRFLGPGEVTGQDFTGQGKAEMLKGGLVQQTAYLLAARATSPVLNSEPSLRRPPQQYTL
jgi:hypothetical protein